MQEHRGCFRWPINWQAQLKLPSREELVKCRIRDINFKGAQISLEERLQKDAFVNLTFVITPELSFDVEAWVVWQGTLEGLHTYGLFFTKMQDKDKEGLYNFIFNKFHQQITEQWWQGIPMAGKGGDAMEDRRIFERFSVDLPLRFLSAADNKEGQALTYNISAKGIGFTSNEQLDPQTALELWLEVPDKGEPIYTRGQVAWSRRVDPDNFRTGVEMERADFMGMSRVLRAIEGK